MSIESDHPKLGLERIECDLMKIQEKRQRRYHATKCNNLKLVYSQKKTHNSVKHITNDGPKHLRIVRNDISHCYE